MPYTGADDPSLPGNVKDAAEDKRAQWVQVWNSVYAGCVEDGGDVSTCEADAFTQANGVLKKRSGIMATLEDLVDRVLEQLRALFRHVSRETLERAWDGSASNYSSTDEYCAACLIDVNAAAGNETKAQSHCMLPVKSPGADGYNFEGIQAAAGGHGVGAVKKPEDVPQDAWDRVVKSAANTIISQYAANDQTAPASVYTAAGKDPPESSERAVDLGNLYDQIWEHAETSMEGWAWVHGVYVENDGSGLFAVVSEGGKLYRSTIAIMDGMLTFGDWTEVLQEFVPTGRTRTNVFRQADGRWRWVSISASAVLNRVGEIDSRDLFDSFVAYAERTGDYPYRTFFHLGETWRTGQADFLAREGNLLITSGLYDDPDDNELAGFEIETQQRDGEYWGESIGYKPTANADIQQIAGIKIPVYRSGFLVEVSTLPQDTAANLFTMTMITQEVARMSQKMREALMRLFGGDEERVEAALAQIDDVNRSIEAEGLITRELDAVTQLLQTEIADESARADIIERVRQLAERTNDAARANTAPAGEPVEVEIDETLAAAIAERVPGSESFGAVVSGLEAQVAEVSRGLAEQVEQILAGLTALNDRLEALEADDDQRRQRWIADLPATRATAFRAAFRPRSERAQDADAPATDAGAIETMSETARARVEGIARY